MARKVVVEVEVPENLGWLDEEDLAGMAKASIERRLRLLKRLEALIPKPLASEEEIMDADRDVKKRLSRRLENEQPRHSDRHQQDPRLDP